MKLLLSFSLQSSLLLLLLFVQSSVSLEIPKLSPTGRRFLRRNSWTQSRHGRRPSSVPEDKDFQTIYYNQTLDHFNYRLDSFSFFQQRYLINYKYWGGSNVSAPILAYLGAEASIDGDLNNIGFLSNENAMHFQALLIYIEHRYYGKSIPFGSREEAFKNASTLGYFNSAQALADYAEILMHVKKQLGAEHSPVIVIGGSYGGMLASWFRLKYPHVALGALASSAPILYFDIIPPDTGYYSIVSKEFRETSETCYQVIKKSWSEIDNIASTPEGLSTLSNKFQTCRPLTNSTELKDYLDDLYSDAAQYDTPPIAVICAAIDGASASTDDILSMVFSGVVAGVVASNSCYVNQPMSIEDTETDEGWTWQVCSEIVSPNMGTSNDTMFQPDAFDLNEFINYCKEKYGVPPRPHWITTYYGGHEIRLILRNFGSNIIFSNGLRDPFSIGGVLESISDSVLAVNTKNGSHCLDLDVATPEDPEWLVNQRRIEVEAITGWIAKYYTELKALEAGKI